MIAYPPHLADIALGKLQPLHTEAHTNLVSLEAGQRDGSSGLNGLCRWYGAVAVYNAGSANGSDGIDWPSWRTAHEYSALYTRSCAREPHPDNAPMLTRILTQAMSLVMVGHIKAAQRTLKGVSAPLLKLIARMEAGEGV